MDRNTTQRVYKVVEDKVKQSRRRRLLKYILYHLAVNCLVSYWLVRSYVDLFGVIILAVVFTVLNTVLDIIIASYSFESIMQEEQGLKNVKKQLDDITED